MSKIQAVIFDLDGTLVDAYQAVAESFNYSLKELGFPLVDFETVKRNVGWGERVLFSRFVPESRIDDLLNIYRSHHTQALRSGVRFLPGAKEMLLMLRDQGTHLAIASNRPSPFTHLILECLNVKDVFARIVCGDQVKNPKPAADMLIKILADLSLLPSQVLYVGDMVVDVQTGQAADVKTVAVLTGSSHEHELKAANPYCVIKGMDELKFILDQA
jgi:HAD superfamily hydrolase (TIGR01549 family)